MPSIEDWLNGLGLGKYADVFAANDIDDRALSGLDNADLQELGISLGHRKVMLAAIQALRGVRPEKDEVEARQPRASLVDCPPPATERPAMTGEPSPDLRLLSVLFCDMVDSTALSGQVGAEKMHELIGAYHDAVASAVTRFGGYVAKFLGDGVLAYFGWPMAYEDHAERAIRAGLAAISSGETLNTPAGAPLRSRVGIASGRVVVGDLAGGGVLDRGQIAGETPNLAARLESLAEPGQIVIADSTRRLAGQAFDFEDLGTHELKGFQERVLAFRIAGEREVESRFDARHCGVLSQFVGRNSEIGILLDHWELAKSGQGQAVFVKGEAGIGKSRLLETLFERLQGEPHELLRLQCSPYHTASALHPVIERLNRVGGFLAHDNALARGEKLQRLLAQYGESPTEVGRVYAELLSLDLGEQFRLQNVSAQQRKELTVRTLTNRAFLAAKRAPVLLVVEDAHWIDPSTSELLAEIVSRIHTAPIFVVVTHRPDWSADWAQGHLHVTTIAVGRLTKQQMRLLIESMLGSVSDRLVDRIVERTDGVPLFVEELTRSILESATRAHENIEIPDSLQGSLMSRLDRLPAPTKEVAQIASVIGREFDRSLLSEVVCLSGPALDDALRQLLAAQIVVSGISRQSLLFRHALIRDTAYQSLLSRKRLRYHQAIADAIVNSHTNVATTQPELVARHYTEARRDDLALPHWKQAGTRALEHSANYEAVDHFSNALAIAEKLPEGAEDGLETLLVRIRFAEALTAAGRLKEAITHFRVAAEHAWRVDNGSTFVRAALGFDLAQFLGGGVARDQSITFLTEAESKIAADDDRQHCLILVRLARAYLLLGDTEKTERLERRASDLARRLGDRESLFNLSVNHFLVPRIASSADVQDRLNELDELLDLAREISDHEMNQRALSLDVYVSTELGKRERANRSLSALTNLGQSRERLHAQWVARCGAAMLAILDGDFATAEVLADEAQVLGRLTSGDQFGGIYGIQMFSIRREQGRLAEVAPVMKRFIDESPDEVIWQPGFALIAADLGFKEPALRRLRQLGEAGFNMPIEAMRSASLSYLAEVAALLDDAESASRLYELMSVYKHMTITAGIATVCYGAGSRYLGMLAATLGELDQAEEHFQHAMAMNADMRAHPWLAHTKAEYALLLSRRGTKGAKERASALANEAWVTAAELGMLRLKKRLQQWIH